MHVPIALLSPRRVFAKVEDVPAYAWPLVLLLVAVTLIGYATIETGLIDREVDSRVQQNIAELEKQQLDVVERSTLSQLIEDERQAGEFLRLMTRIRVVAVEPAAALASVLLLSALLFGVVALTGRKPEWHTLLTICVFASFVDVIGGLVRLGFMLRFSTLWVDTSLGLLMRLSGVEGDAAAMGGAAKAAWAGLLTGADPFRIWFWIVMVVGLSMTSQLRGWKVWVTCSFLWLSAAGIRAALLATAAGNAGSA